MFGLVAGANLDLANGYDVDNKEDQERAWKIARTDEPALLIGSPPCACFSMLQELNIAVHGNNDDWMCKFKARKEKAIRHVQLYCDLYQFRLSQGRHLLHSHPRSAGNWSLQCVNQLLNDDRVMVAQGHMCRFGMTSHIDRPGGREGAVKKPTGFMTFSWCTYEELNKAAIQVSGMSMLH